MSTTLILTALAALGACGKAQSTLFADHAIPLVAPAASAETAPLFVGRWAASEGQCRTPWVIQARSLSAGAITCEFDRVDSSSAGYVVTSLCRLHGQMQPSRLSIVLPNLGHATTLTISGAPFTDAVALERCPAQP